MKVDVEGAEHPRARGRLRALAEGRIGLLQLEWNDLSESLLGESRSVVAEILRGHGYELSPTSSDSFARRRPRRPVRSRRVQHAATEAGFDAAGRDERMTGVKVHLRNPRRELEFDGPISIITLLRELSLNRESVLVIKGDTLVPGDEMLDDTDTVEIKPVISGGAA